VPILVYHHVYRDDDPALARLTNGGLGISTARQFRTHLEMLASAGWTIVSHSRLVDWLTRATTLPQRAAVVHFDNGWLDVFDVAKPLLDQFDAVATCFVISDVVEQSSAAAADAADGGAGNPATTTTTTTITTTTEGKVQASARSAMGWHHLRQLLQDGWDIGAHTATHRKLTQVHADEGDAGVLREIEVSNALIERRLGCGPRHFAYPSGAWSEQIENVISPAYRSLRLWDVQRWTFTDRRTPPSRLACQNIDLLVSDQEFADMLGIAA